MILPCRTRRIRRFINSLSLAFLSTAFSLTLHNQAMAQYGAGSISGAGAVGGGGGGHAGGGGGGGSYIPLQITAGVDVGYDNNVLGSNTNSGGSGRGSFSVRENLVLTYDRFAKPTEVHLIGVARFTQFPAVGADDKDLSLTLGLLHNFSTRLSLTADVYAAYQTEPNFQSNVGPENVRAPHFDTHSIFALSYHWLPRLSSITSFTLERVDYLQTTQQTIATTTTLNQQDRFQYTLGEGLQLSFTTRTNLVLQYRYLIVDYDSAPRDTTTHFALVGFDHNLTEDLVVNVLGGASFRSFQDDGSSIDPYGSVNVSYRGRKHSLSWSTTYGVEQSTQTLSRGSTTFRTGLNATYGLTSRINARAAVYYYNSNNQGSSGTTTSTGTTSTGAQDGLQFTLGLNYGINNHWAVNASSTYSAQFSSGRQGNYSRNSYFAGVTYTY
jgi:Putative beta-barrel porin 2